MLSRIELEELRLTLAQKCNIPAAGIQIYDNGNFHIYNVRENDAVRIVNNLRMDPEITRVSMNRSSYDFGHFDKFLQPTQKYTIDGNIEVE